MEISATDMRSTIAGTPACSMAPKQETGTSAQASGGDKAPVSNTQMQQMVEQMQSHLDSMNVSLQYSFYGANDDKVAVKVVNRETGEVIREIPAKEMQALQTKMRELVGMIFNDSV